MRYNCTVEVAPFKGPRDKGKRYIRNFKSLSTVFAHYRLILSIKGRVPSMIRDVCILETSNAERTTAGSLERGYLLYTSYI